MHQKSPELVFASSGLFILANPFVHFKPSTMGDYLRTTRQCSLHDLRPSLLAALRNHAEKTGLDNIEQQAIACCETISTAKKKRLFSRKKEVVVTGAIATPEWLVIASGKEGEPPGVLSERLQALRIVDYEQSEMFKRMEDSGLNIFGFTVGTLGGASSGSFFLPLGPEPAASAFRAILKETASKA